MKIRMIVNTVWTINDKSYNTMDINIGNKSFKFGIEFNQKFSWLLGQKFVLIMTVYSLLLSFLSLK